MAKILDDRYLGDGVYASHDGFHIWLDLRGQDGTTRIALDSQVQKALVLFKHDADLIIDASNVTKGEENVNKLPEDPT